jgi:molybdopterin molybdotransferase
VIPVSELPGIDDALALVLARVRPLPLEDVPIAAAAGRVLGSDALAAVDLPPFDSSAMDGYAVRAADTPGLLSVVGHSAAGRPELRTVGRGEAVVISTGAVVPAGADAVVPVEETTGDVSVESVSPGENVRPRAGDVGKGEVVVQVGRQLGPPQVAALAAAGIASVSCSRRPRVAVLATGSELRAPGELLGPGEIYESNSLLIAAQLELSGLDATVFPAVSDDPAATKDALERGLEHDVLVTTGGVSVGPHDLVRATLAELGATEVFWRVAVKPGKPIAFAVRGDTLVFGLPGNPISSLVGFELFVRPALRALEGALEPGPHYLSGRLARAVARNAQRDELLRARRNGDRLEPLDGQDSHMIVRAAAANALVLIPRGAGEMPQGAEASYLPI